MDYQFSKWMKKRRSLYRWVIPVIFLFCVASSFALAGIYFSAAQRVSEKEVPVVFDASRRSSVYSSLNAQIMTEEFASDFKETNHYYFVGDESFVLNIVQVHGDLTEECQALIDYLYSDSEVELPPPVRFVGMSMPIEEDIRQFAIETYNEIMGEDVVDDSNFEDYFGSYYLDTTRRPESPMSNWSTALYALAALILVCTAMYAVKKSSYTRKNRAVLMKYPDETLQRIDQELTQPLTVSYPEDDLYLTSHYIVSDAGGLEILPYEEIVRVYEANGGASSKLIRVETRDRVNHTILKKKAQGRHAAGFAAIFGAVKRKIEEQNAYAQGLEESAVSSETTLNRGEEDPLLSIGASFQKTEPMRKSRVIPGIIGAVGGSLVGVALWIVLGQVGFIAGIAGFVMLKFALMGYGKLSGRLDRKGAFISLVIAAFMILGANVADYMLSIMQAYFKFEASFETAWYVLTHFGSLMSEFDMWGRFLLNLGIGYVLSIWSSASMIRSIFHYK